MKKNLFLINENQYGSLRKHLVESQIYTKNVKLVLDYLVENYEPAVASVQYGDIYQNEKRIKKRIDETEMSPRELFVNVCAKFPKISKDFLKQVILDWYNGTIGNDLSLSRNVSF